jgi:hypothetical protein
MSRTTSATAHPAVMTPVTSWSFASSGGGGEGRVSGSLVRFTPSGYEVPATGAAAAHGSRATLRAAVPILEKLSQSS